MNITRCWNRRLPPSGRAGTQNRKNMELQQSEIKKRIRSVGDIRQMTHAMHLISAVKMRRARQQLEKTMPFFALCAETMIEMQESGMLLDNRYMTLRQKKPGETWKIGYFILTGDQ